MKKENKGWCDKGCMLASIGIHNIMSDHRFRLQELWGLHLLVSFDSFVGFAAKRVGRTPRLSRLRWHVRSSTSTGRGSCSTCRGGGERNRSDSAATSSAVRIEAESFSSKIQNDDNKPEPTEINVKIKCTFYFVK